MSYLTTKTVLTNYLSSLGYTELPNIIEFEDAPLSMNHRSYVLKPEGFEFVSLANDASIASHLLRLEIQYKNVNTSERDSNYNDFLTLAKGIGGLSGFLNYTSEPSFIDDVEAHTLGTLKFYYGAEC